MTSSGDRPPGRAPRRRLVLLGLAVIAIPAVVFVALQPLGGDPHESFVPLGSATTGLQLGQIAPGTAQDANAGELLVRDLDGNPVTLAQYAGHPLWLVYWKTACEPCESEAPDIAAAAAAHRDSGLVILGIDVWDSAAVARDDLASHPKPYPVAVDEEGEFLVAYGLWGAPTHYFISADGVIVDRFFGPIDPEQIESSLARIL
jgi:peroxiredoxin